MCYSALIEASLKKYAALMNAQIDVQAFTDLFALRARHREAQIPAGMEFDLLKEPAIASSVGDYLRNDIERLVEEAAGVDREIAELEAKPPAITTQTKLKGKGGRREKLTIRIDRLIQRLEHPNLPATFRVFPLDFAPIVILQNGNPTVIPARYHLLPKHGREIRGIYNCRRDSLQIKPTWKPIFGKRHALVMIKRFFEQVPDPERPGKNREVLFTPNGYDHMIVPCLWERSHHPVLGEITSFAIVTDDPPAEISDLGHDRCPVFLTDQASEVWLKPEGKSLTALDALLNEKERPLYTYDLAV